MYKTFKQVEWHHCLGKGKKLPITPKEYQGLNSFQIAKKVSLESSDNGRCWWIYQHLMSHYLNPITY